MSSYAMYLEEQIQRAKNLLIADRSETLVSALTRYLERYDQLTDEKEKLQKDNESLHQKYNRLVEDKKLLQENMEQLQKELDKYRDKVTEDDLDDRYVVLLTEEEASIWYVMDAWYRLKSANKFGYQGNLEQECLDTLYQKMENLEQSAYEK